MAMLPTDMHAALTSPPLGRPAANSGRYNRKTGGTIATVTKRTADPFPGPPAGVSHPCSPQFLPSIILHFSNTSPPFLYQNTPFPRHYPAAFQITYFRYKISPATLLSNRAKFMAFASFIPLPAFIARRN
jgi:hypothetical protein